jgi:respiratory burst oxidase
MGGDEVETVSSSSDDIQLIQRVHHNNGSSFSGPLNQRVGRRSAKLNFSNSSSAIDLSHHNHNKDENEQDYVEVTMDIQGDSVALHSVKTIVPGNNNDHAEDDKLALLGKGIEKKRSFGSSFVRTASIRMKQVSQELKKLTSFSKQVGPDKVYDRTKSAASHALIGLKFINKKTDGDGDGVGWFEVEKQFEILSSDDGLLHRSLFAKCIGIVEYKSMFECFVTVVPTLLIRDVVSGV